ncbi:Uncharacterized protein FWK35_00027459 [Aphis craccivora]|uniref:Uncharacterized protein n=1 Tax=Aphis craccivora TaxID=307492 RepID=A0A6G0VV35_APHCR|nr:Uncharacterized protein FWK35_00027459 [Aphis craccivora]
MLALHSRRGDARQREHESVVGSLVSSRLVSPCLVRAPFGVGFFVASQRTRATRRGLSTTFSRCLVLVWFENSRLILSFT